MKPTPAILLVEDSPAEIKITERALQESGDPVELIVVRDGQEALDYLLRQGDYADSPAWRSPALVLLDLNLPRVDGREVLAEVKADPALAVIPLVVLTTSAADEDVLRAYGLHANCYVTKPLDFAAFARVVATIKDFWFDVATLPPG